MKNVTSFLILLVGFNIATVCASQDAHESNDNNNNILNRVNLKNPKDENSVYNFQSVCEQLCGTGFGGPICGAQCGQQINNYLQNDVKSNELIEKSDDVCPILCEYGLGIPNCKCTIRTKREANFSIQPVCDSFCSADLHITGCGVCGRNAAAKNDLEDDNESTTPNWALLCIELCKIGDGGVLCKCDLPPFF